MPKKEYISNKLTLSAVFVIALIVFVIPLGFYLSSYRYMEGELNAEAIYIADNVNEIIGRNPVMWQYEQMRLLDAISKSQAAYADLHVRVLRMDETMVVEMDSYVRKPFMRKQIAIYDAGVPVGTVETSRSLVPLLGSTFVIGFISFVIGWLFFYTIKILFLKSLLATEKALMASEMELKNLVEEAPLAITVVNKAGELVYINRRNIEVIGYTRNETPTLESWWSSAYPDPEERKKISALWGGIQQRVLNGENVGMVVRRITCKDGTTI
jgi:PAS domain S-box-containing protein